VSALRPEHVIGTTAALRAVSDDQRQRILNLLVGAPLGAAEIASRLRVASTRVYYHLNLLEKNGLIRVVEERPAGRRVERIYRAVARWFRVDPRLIGGGKGVARARRAILAQAMDDFRKALVQQRAGEDPTLVMRTFVRLRPAQIARLRLQLLKALQSLDPSQQEGETMEIAIALFPARR